MTNQFPPLYNCTIAVLGLGYVGLPLAVEFSKSQICCRTKNRLSRRTIGFDVNKVRIEDLRNLQDKTNELSFEELSSADNLHLTTNESLLAEADVFIVTVPTPIDKSKRPDMTALQKASSTVGQALKKRSKTTIPFVIYESTVYPGVTEEVCVPILEAESELEFNKGFFCGYSPERINPGDNINKLTTIVKVTSGSTPEAATWVDNLYGSIIKAGTHKSPSLKVAEAAKVIENTQRDLNIALVNELSIIFSLLNIDTLDVLEAAGTKWNFLPFRPGLVGGHCIGVDPYYLTHKSEQEGYMPQVVLAGRRINDGMGKWIAEQLVLKLCRRKQSVSGTHVLILGFAFKENCPDFRNTKVIDLIISLQKYGLVVEIIDPYVDADNVNLEYNVKVSSSMPGHSKYGAVIAAVAHTQYKSLKDDEWLSLLEPDGIFLDLKGIIPRHLNPIRI